MTKHQSTPADLCEARRQALLDAAGVLRSWLADFGATPIQHTSPQEWARGAMTDCIEEIEAMAEGAATNA